MCESSRLKYMFGAWQYDIMTSGPTNKELPGHLSHGAFPVLILGRYLSGSINCEEHLLLILDSGKNDFDVDGGCTAEAQHQASTKHENYIEVSHSFNGHPRKTGMTKQNACCSYREPTIHQNSKWLCLFQRQREREREAESFYWPASVNAFGAVPAASSEIETSIASSASSPASTSLTRNATQHEGLFVGRARQENTIQQCCIRTTGSFLSISTAHAHLHSDLYRLRLNIWTLTSSIFSHWSCATLSWGNLQLLGALLWRFASSQNPVSEIDVQQSFTVTDSPPSVVKHWSLVWDGCITSSVVQSSTHSSANGDI